MVPLHARRLTTLLFLALLAALPGCGPSRPGTVPVRGTVTLDGQPLAGAAVMFMPPAGRPAAGVTDQTGQFQLTTFANQDGALLGPHAVTVSLCKETGVMADKDGLSGGVAPEGIRKEWVTPERYASPETSELKVEVRSGMPPVRLELTSR
jgi:hypothetical protein